VTVNYFDAFWQPLLTRTYDSADEANTRRLLTGESLAATSSGA
jgi:enterochelin esterase-like enzyme